MIAARLTGRRVLVTRALEDSRTWAERLAALGAEPVLLPCIHSEALDDAATRARLGAALADADWLCVMSPHGAEAVARLAGALPPALRVAVVGEATGVSARASLGRANVVARGGTSRALGEELLRGALAAAPGPQRVVVAGAVGGRTDADDTLADGGAVVTRVDVYRTVPASVAPSRRDLGAERITDVLLASPSAVHGLLNQALVPPTVRVFTIGPTTSAAVRAAGLSVSGEAASPDLDSLVEVMQ